MKDVLILEGGIRIDNESNMIYTPYNLDSKDYPKLVKELIEQNYKVQLEIV